MALGKKYRILARQLAIDLEKYSPNTPFIIFTDDPDEFDGFGQVFAFKHEQKGIKTCYHDRRYVLLKALSMFGTAIFLDADTGIRSEIPDNDIKWPPGITGKHKKLLEGRHTERRPIQMALSEKLQIDVNNAQWVNECLFVITRDNGQGNSFSQSMGQGR